MSKITESPSQFRITIPDAIMAEFGLDSSKEYEWFNSNGFPALREKPYDFIFIVKKPGFDLETATEYVLKNKVWDFLSSTTPSYALRLRPGHRIRFYIPKKDQEGNMISPYSSFFATAVLASKYMKEWNGYENVVKLKDISPINPPEPVNNPIDYQIGKGRDKAFIVPYKKRRSGTDE